MPLYTFTCLNCDTDTEKIVAIKDRDYQTCSVCGYNLNRNIDSPALVWSPTANGGFSG